MYRNASLKAAAAIVLAALLFSQAAVALAAESPRAARVVVVLAPYLTWDDIAHGPMPATRALVASGLVANANVRSAAVGGGAPSLTRGALMLSAGASALTDPEALSAYGVTETVDGASAGDAYRQLFGSPARGSVVYLGQPRQAVANRRTTLGNRLGALGGAIRAAGRRTAAIGTSDPGMAVDPLRASRPAGIIAADESGLVAVGDVSTATLVADPAAPFGVRTDPGRLEAAYRAAIADDDVALVVVDPGDLSRAYELAALAATPTATAARTRAVRATDDVVGMVARDADADTLVILVAPVVPEVQDEPPAFAPVVLSGAGMGTGLASAASTHRVGMVTVMDVAVTVLDALGASRPSEMVGSVIAAAPGTGGPADERLAILAADNTTALAVEVWRLAIINTFITLTVIALLVSALLLYRGAEDVPAWVCVASRTALLAMPCVPLGALLLFAVVPRPGSPAIVLAGTIGIAALVLLAAIAAGRGRPPAVPLVVITGLTTAVIVVDQVLGAPLSFSTVFGYSPLAGARYYGLGNEMAGLVLGSALVCAALALDVWRDAPWAGWLRRWGWPLVGAIVLVTSAAPFWGANVGTVAWMTIGFLTGWMMLNGHRVFTWRTALIAVAIVAVAVVGISVIDLMGGERTHLARALGDAEGGGGLGSLMTIVARKAETNLRVLGRTNWTWLLLAILLLLGYMRWRPRGEFATMLAGYPAYAAAIGAALFAGVVGYFTEDSGIIIPALLILPIGVGALYLMMTRPGWGCGGDS